MDPIDYFISILTEAILISVQAVFVRCDLATVQEIESKALANLHILVKDSELDIITFGGGAENLQKDWRGAIEDALSALQKMGICEPVGKNWALTTKALKSREEMRQQYLDGNLYEETDSEYTRSVLSRFLDEEIISRPATATLH